MAYQGVKKRAGDSMIGEEFDIDTYADIMYELLMKWRQPDKLDARSGIEENTALHLAVGAENVRAVKNLIGASASTAFNNEKGKIAVQIVMWLIEQTPEAQIRENSALVLQPGKQ